MPIRITRSIVPNLFTLANLLAGFTAIVLTSQQDFKRAAAFILVAGIFDMLDGVMARLINSTSEFGVELDSLCDAVSFGVAPGYMLYMAHFNQDPRFGILLAALPAMAGVLRLARFNVQLTSLEDKLYFRGMPIPSGALTIVSYIVFIHFSEYISSEYKGLAITLVSVLTSLAMVSTIKYDNLPRPSLRSIKQRPIIFSIFIIAIILCIATKGSFIFPFMMLYMIGGAIRQVFLWMRERRADEDEDDTVEEVEPDPLDM